MRLPLSDAEKAEAVRRLLAGLFHFSSSGHHRLGLLL